MLLISYPILLSNIAVEVNQIINRALAVKLGNGLVSSLTYASTLSIFVSSTLIYSLVTIFFTEFSKTACTNDASDKLKKLLRFALNILLCVLLPLSLITFLYAEDIVTITFKRGKFTADNVISTAQVLRWFAIGFMAVVCKTLFIKCFIAMKDTRTPMCVGICEVCLNISLTLMFYRRFQVAGIAVALSAANICAAAALLCLLNCKLKRHTILWSWKYTARILGSAAVSIIFLLLANRILENWNAWLRFPTAALIGVACFLPVYWFEWRNYCHIHNNSLTE